MTPEQEIYLANRAKEVLENEAYTKAIADLKTEITDQWKNSPARDTEGREKLWLMLSLLEKVQSALETTMAGAAVAKDALRYQQYKQAMQ